MITVLFHVRVKPDRQPEFHELAVRLTELTRAEDEGCLAYTYLQQTDKPNEYVLYEQWTNEASVSAHLTHLQRLIGPPAPDQWLPKAFMDLCERTQVFTYNVVA